MKRKNIILIISIIVILVFITSVSYAFFSARITKINETKTKVQTNTLGLEFNGTKEIEYNSMIPGDKFEKTFTVKNISNRAVTYNIYLENIINEFDDFLVYKLDDNKGHVIEETVFPITNPNKTNIKTDISIASGETITYTMTIEYKYSETVDQSSTKGHRLQATLGIDTALTYTVTFDPNGGSINVFKNGNLSISPSINYTVDNNMYNITTNNPYPEIILPSNILKDGKKYKLKFKFQKISGILKSVGGHSPDTTQISFKIDGVSQSSNYSYYSDSITDDTNVHEVEYEFTFSSGQDNRLFIQINRAFGGEINYKLWDIEILEENYIETKTVAVGNTYGDLPIPTREGYTFKGWHGKNMIKELKNENYSLVHYESRTTHEFKNDGEFDYIRINGYYQNGCADTSWRIQSFSDLNIISSKKYMLSFDVRTNAINQTITNYYRFGGHTSIYNADTSIAPSLLSFEVPNDEQWYKYSQVLTANANTSNGYILVGNDYPNLCGQGAYMDIANIQLEEGSTATAYEPYYITNSTQVVQAKNHTLTAIWEEN